MIDFKNKNDRISLSITIIFHILLLIILFYFGINHTPKLKEKEAILLLNFSGSQSSGGSSSESPVVDNPKETQINEPAVSKPVITQKNSTTSTTNNNNTQKNSNNNSSSSNSNSKNKIRNNSTFQGSGNGNGNSNGNGLGNNGLGDGEDGNGISGKIGDAGNRTVLYKPEIINPNTETGKVAVKIYVDKSGKVVNAEHVKNKSTSNNPEHISEALSFARKYKLTPDPNASNLESTVITISFVVK